MFLIYIYTHSGLLSHRPTTSHNKQEPRAQGPKTEIRKRKNKEKGKKKKIPLGDSEQGQATREAR